MKARGSRPSAFIVFKFLGTLMKHDAGVFRIKRWLFIILKLINIRLDEPSFVLRRSRRDQEPFFQGEKSE